VGGVGYQREGRRIGPPKRRTPEAPGFPPRKLILVKKWNGLFGRGVTLNRLLTMGNPTFSPRPKTELWVGRPLRRACSEVGKN